MAVQRQPWNQLEEEPDAAYTHFLAYRNLGPGRSIRDAEASVRPQKAVKGRTASGSWQRESVAYDWFARATAWDIHNLQTAGEAASVNLIHVVERAASQVLAALTTHGIRPKTWPQTMEAVKDLVTLIPEETRRAAFAPRSAPDPQPSADEDTDFGEPRPPLHEAN